jgi:hypothetical protein
MIGDLDDNPHMTGETRDYMRDPWYRVDAVGPNGRCSFGSADLYDLDKIRVYLDKLKAEHPEYTLWAITKFEPWFHISVVE